MHARYDTLSDVWERLPGILPPHEHEVSLESALSILDELAAARPPAFVSFLDAPRVIHIYFESEADRVRYEFFHGMEQELCGLTSLAESKEAVRQFFVGQSPRQFLASHSFELYEDKG